MDTPRPELTPNCGPTFLESLDPELFAALADRNRLILLCRLAVANGPRTVTELADCCGVHISGVSRHLAKLKSAGIVSAEKNGREVRYWLEQKALSTTLRGLAEALDACCADDESCR